MLVSGLQRGGTYQKNPDVGPATQTPNPLFQQLSYYSDWELYQEDRLP
ncbi:hypothetical protein LINPERHAP2_LOCUS20751 [Linum perenne]